MRPEQYAVAREIAEAVIDRRLNNPVGDSIYFNAKNIRPSHVRNAPLRATIGNHNFFAALSAPARSARSRL